VRFVLGKSIVVVGLLVVVVVYRIYVVVVVVVVVDVDGFVAAAGFAVPPKTKR